MLFKHIAFPPQDVIFRSTSYDKIFSPLITWVIRQVDLVQKSPIRLSRMPSHLENVSSLISNISNLLLTTPQPGLEPFEKNTDIVLFYRIDPKKGIDYEINHCYIKDDSLRKAPPDTLQIIKELLTPYIQAMLKTAKGLAKPYGTPSLFTVLLRTQTVKEGQFFEGLAIHQDDLQTRGSAEEQPVTILAYDTDNTKTHKGDLILCADQSGANPKIITPETGTIVAFNNAKLWHGTHKFNGTRSLMSLFLYHFI